MRIIRVFPRKLKSTPDDDLVFFGDPPLLAMPDADEAHISVLFTWDIPKAEELAKQWEMTGLPVKIGGVAYNMRGEDFVPGKYVKHGYTITSRGCPNKCWFCSVWKRDGTIRELEIKTGNNILDDNILACSKNHLTKVFEMLSTQKQVQFTGGLEANILTDWHVENLRKLSIDQMFFAYDTPDDYEPLVEAGKKLKEVEFRFNQMRCYVLIGHPKDTFDKAEKRLWDTVDAGFMPMAMLWRNNKGDRDKEWMKFQKVWARPAIIKSRIKERKQCG